MTQVIAPYEQARNQARRLAGGMRLARDRITAWRGGMLRIKARIAKHGAAIREEDGRVVPVTGRWMADLIERGVLRGRMWPNHKAKFFRNYGTSGGLNHRLVLSRKQVSWFQRAASGFEN